MDMKRYQMTLCYKGSVFAGWQRQPHSPSIQAHLEMHLKTLLKAPHSLIASGRTDAGVHALGQVAHFDTQTSIDTAKILKALNALTHPDIAILDLIPAPEGFHARYSARSKIYHYHVWTDPFPSPFLQGFRYHQKQPFDLNKLKQALPSFVGYKNFRSFSNSPDQGACKKNPFRHLYRLECFQQEGGFRLEFEANGFLYKMVRNIVGTLIEVGRHKLSIEKLEKIFAAEDRRAAPKTAAAHGLFLVKVHYDS